MTREHTVTYRVTQPLTAIRTNESGCDHSPADAAGGRHVVSVMSPANGARLRSAAR